MNSELNYVHSPWRSRLFWLGVYLAVGALLAAGIYYFAGKLTTHRVPTGDITLSVPYSTYLVGETVTFSIKNNFNSPVFVTNNCPSEPLAVYRFENNTWVRIRDQATASDCAGQDRQITVPASGIVSGTFAPWHHLFVKPGKYRITAYVEFYNALPYQDIEIIVPPTPAPTPPPVAAGPDVAPSTAQPGAGTTTKPAPFTAKQSKTITTNRGSISVQYDASRIYVTQIAPASGCTYEGGRSGPQVEVTFKCRNGETQVALRLVNGQLIVSTQAGRADGDD